ncbi:MAG: OmpA family protein [Cytophagales bacterium]|nr:OmpA family protein [Cytophagales bacterium]
MVKWTQQIALLLVLALVPQLGHTQAIIEAPKKNARFQSILLPSRNPDLFQFPNLNKIRYYRKNKLYEKIRQLDKQEQWVTLYPLLKEYVRQFGVENFFRDTYLLWRLAQLTELYASKEEAIPLYRLVLKHHRKSVLLVPAIQQLKDESEKKRKQYVSLKEYFELVEFRTLVDTLRPPVGIRQNMGYYVNSQQSDYAPTLSTDNQILIFTSRRNFTSSGFGKKYNEDLYICDREGDDWDEARLIDGINSQANEGSACISRDGKTLFFSRCDAPNSYGNCDLYQATWNEDSLKWGSVRNLGANVNSSAWDSQPSLSLSGDTLYFASDRIGGFGLSDIYYSVKSSKGWSRAKNAGPLLNTRGNEISPFAHPNGHVLYFSSDGHMLNFGRHDIYKSYRLNSQLWSEPINIGPLVNSEQDELYFTIDADFRKIYYAKSIENNFDNLDLYSFPVPMGAHPDARTAFTGSLLDENSNPFKGIVSIIDMEEGIEVAPKFLDANGRFQFHLIDKRRYLLVIQGEDFFRIEKIFFLDGDTEMNEQTAPISRLMRFASIEFDEGAHTILASMYGDLNKIANFLLDHPDFKLIISGHTDSTGDAKMNLSLSQRRAESIKEYLTYFGNVPEVQIEAIGRGNSQPIKKIEKTEEDRKLNRRVEFEIYRLSGKELEEHKKAMESLEEDNLEDW